MRTRQPARTFAPPRAVHLAALAGVLLVLVAGAALRLIDAGPLPLDAWWHGVAGVAPGSATRAVAVFMAEVGAGLGAAVCGAIACALCLALQLRRDALAVALTLIIGVASSEAIKALVMRPRPWDQLYGVHGTSFPSGHSMGAAALAVAIALVVTQNRLLPHRLNQFVWWGAACWAVLMMWSRTALHVHWASDVLAGAVLGGSIAVLVRIALFRESRSPGASSQNQLSPSAS